MPGDSTSEHARQFKRHETAFEARIEPHPDHVDQFRLSFPDAQSGLAVTDVSAGGVGLICGLYLPRNLRLTLHITGVGADHEADRPLLNIRAISRRCQMIDHKPTYQVGLQFIDATGPDEQRLIQAADTSKPGCAAVGAGGSSGS